MNKKLVILGLILVGLSASVYAEPKRRQSGMFMRDAGEFVSEAVYVATTTCSSLTVSDGNALISTRAAYLFSLVITSAGSANASVAIWDASRSTSVQVRQIAQYIDASTEEDFVFNVGLSSGLIVTSGGTIPACISCLYYEK